MLKERSGIYVCVSDFFGPVGSRVSELCLRIFLVGRHPRIASSGLLNRLSGCATASSFKINEEARATRCATECDGSMTIKSLSV